MTTPKRPRGAMTSAEHDEWLKETGQYEAVLETQRQRRAELEARWAACDKALVPVVEALQAAGCPVSSPGDMLRLADEKPRLYIEAIPILLDHLRRPYPSDARVQIAAALYTRATEVIWNKIVSLFRAELDERVRDRLANVIDICANRERLDEIIGLVRDPKNGPSRILLLRILSRSRDPRAKQTLHEMANDPDLATAIALKLNRHKKRMH